jgi:hypothetical protein
MRGIIFRPFVVLVRGLLPYKRWQSLNNKRKKWLTRENPPRMCDA